METISCTCNNACPVHGNDWIATDSQGVEHCVTCLGIISTRANEKEIMALNRAISRAKHHLEETRRNWTPGIPEAEADYEALQSLLSRTS